MAWKVIHPSRHGNCTIRLGDGPNENDFRTLFPLDKSADKKGRFPCGRALSDIEGKEFKVPANLSCDICTLQLEWITDLGQIHLCSDISILDKEI